MSVVTTVVVIGQEADDDTYMQAFNFKYRDVAWANRMHMGELDACAEYIGGSKCAESDIYVGAFNLFDHYGWLDHLETIKWSYPEHLVVIITSSDLDFTEVWKPTTNRTQ